MKKLLITLAITLAFLTTCSTTVNYTRATVDHLRERTVKVIGSSWGSGTIIKSLESESFILTNSHVCASVVESGTILTANRKLVAITKFIQSAENTDLCLVKVPVNLGLETKASETPAEVGDSVYVSGHPLGLPFIITLGHLSEEMSVQVSENGVVSFKSQLTSALVSPGSSGSGVYNDSLELIGVIFAAAGRGGPTYGYLIPWSVVDSFLLDVKAGKLRWQTPTRIMIPYVKDLSKE